MDTETKRKYPFSMKHDLMKEIICTPEMKKIETVKNLPLTSYAFTVNTLDGEVTNAAAISNTSTELYILHFHVETHFQPVPSLTYPRPVHLSGPIKI